jgi:hypothetical protein
MGDMAEDFKVLKEINQKRKQGNLEKANDDGWKKHTPYHWSRNLNGSRLDYWPSTTKFKYKGRLYVGGIDGFIKNKELEK